MPQTKHTTSMKPTFYQSEIMNATKCTFAESIQVEEIMRSVAPTMGHLSKLQLRKLAVQSFSVYHKLL